MKLPKNLFFRSSPIIRALTVTALLGCSGLAQAAPEAGPGHEIKVGFYLLHDVCHEESQVHLIAMLKTTPPDVIDFVNRVSKRATQSLTSIDRMENDDSSLKIDQNPLPLFEQEVRQSIRDDKQHQLLFGTSGPKFTHALLVSQIEATTYIAHIAKVLSEKDHGGDRADTERKISAQWEALRDQAFRLLNAS